MSTPQVIGQRRENVKVREITGEDPFREAPFYAAGAGTETLNGIAVDTMICGIFRGLRESRTANSSGSKSHYLCMELEGGDLIRVMAPTQLRNVLTDEKVENGTYIELTYKGEKAPVSGEGRAYHLFHVNIGETLN